AWLPQLVVVTYTNRAADEMQQRTRQQIIEAGLPIEVVEAFNRAFFGTIHSFCVKLLATYRHHLGLPANLELVTDDDDLWNNFVTGRSAGARPTSSRRGRRALRRRKSSCRNGGKRFGHCANGSTPVRSASPPKCNAITANSDWSAAP